MKYSVLAAFFAFAPSLAAAPIEFRKGDHICIIGNTLAERMQHDGWFETLLHASYPNHELVVRNLGFSGDELTTRLRSANFGSPDEWLTKCQADVIFAFFGYNESFGGEAGLPKFKADLEAFIKHTMAQKYNGKSAPRLVLISPLAHEDMRDRKLPDGKENNRRMAIYSAAMAAIAKHHGVAFFDLFQFSKSHNDRIKDYGFTDNGIHLDSNGSYLVSEIIAGALLGDRLNSGFPKHGGLPGTNPFPELRAAVNDKNFYWFQRYRTTDGYSIYGGRADLKFTNGQTNREVAQREMEVLDVMTANRDKAVWATAQGKPFKVDDSNLPPFIAVITNKPGAGPNGTHVFLSGDEAIKKMTVDKGLKVNLFASEEQFPELAKPVQMTWDAKGRLWVAVWPSYPHWKPTEPMNDKILIFEDTDGDGKADKMTVFADKLHNPTGFELYNGGLIVAQAPDLMFLKDSDGDGKADVRERILHGLDSADTHHTANSFVLDPGGALYFQEGTFHHTQVETPWGPPVRNVNAGVYRFEPKTFRFETYVSYGFANPHGHAFDRWGQDIVVDGTGAQPYHAALFSGHLPYPHKHPHPPQVYQQRTRPCPGIEILSSKHFPEEWQGNLLVGNVISFQGILRYRIDDAGSSFRGTELEPILSSTDPNFRPSDLKIGPDGALYFLDWQNPIIGHMQHNLRDPSRDRTHGRIYRVTYEGRPLSQSPVIAGQPVEKLLELLKHPENRVRYRARGELGARKAEEVLPATERWLASLDKNDPDYEHHRLEGLWVHQWHDAVGSPLLKEVLGSPDFRARAAAVRVLCYQRHRIPETLDLLRKLAGDSHPRVRLEAVRAASFLTVPEAIEVALISAALPTDVYLDYVRAETMRALDPLWKAAVAKGEKIHFTTDAGANFLLRSASVEQLVAMPKTRPACLEMLYHAGVRDEQRREALKLLAQMDRTSELRVLLDAIARIDGPAEQREPAVVFDLVRLLSGRSQNELATVRNDLEKLATGARQPVIRQVGYVALVSVDGAVDNAWSVAAKSDRNLGDLLAAVPLIADPGARAALYPKIEPLLTSSRKPAIRHAAMTALVSVRGHETQSFQTLVKFLRDDADRTAAVRALQKMPRTFWPKDEAAPLLETLIAHIRTVPAAKRTSDDVVDLLEFADALASLLPIDAARKARTELGELGVRVIRIGTLPERMAYDKEVIVVRAGKPVEFVLQNDDLMPHNFVVANPGALETLGLASEEQATDPEFAKNGFIPKSNQILLASKLLAPRETQKLSFVAPKQPGVYPYVCTYPGHWRRMNGALHVVFDLEGYQAEPEAYLATHAIAIQDPLLKDRRPRTEWKYEELLPAVAELRKGRNFANGRAMFTVATCVGCHKLEGQGKEFGPDLTKLEAKSYEPAEMLRGLLEPSSRIDEKHASHRIQLATGKVVTGMILEESATEVKLIENPLVKAEPIVLKKADIESREKSPVSLMPKGLLDKLTHDEALDLIAYVMSKGEKSHALFQGGEHEHAK